MTEEAAKTPRLADAARIRHRSLTAAAVREFRRFVMLFLYLWLLFGVFVLNQGIVLREQGVNFTLQGFAVVNALVFAKIMMAFEMLDPGGWLRRRPLIAPILFETTLLTALFVVVHILEKSIEGVFHGKPFLESFPRVGGGGLTGLFSASVMLFVALLPFFGLRNLNLVMGDGWLWSLLFRSPHAAEGDPLQHPPDRSVPVDLPET